MPEMPIHLYLTHEGAGRLLSLPVALLHIRALCLEHPGASAFLELRLTNKDGSLLDCPSRLKLIDVKDCEPE